MWSKSIVLCLCMMLTGTASFAKGERLLNLSDNVNALLKAHNGKLTKSERRAVRFALLEVQDILESYGSIDVDKPDQATLKCTARDNDGRNPWMVGFANGLIGAATTKISNTVLGSAENCRSSIDNARSMSNGAKILCGTRDNDGRSPFTVVIAKANSETLVTKAIASNLSACLSVVKGLKKIRKEGAVFCVSRDNDARGPYVKAAYTLDHSIQYGSETFSSLDQCMSSI